MLIWVQGRIVPEDAPLVPAEDRVLEHGLGLFETLRTWGGVAPLLPRHLARMRRSAEVLGLPVDPAALPDAVAIVRLLEANGGSGDALIRITLTGGTAAGGCAYVAMRQGPLPPDLPRGGARLALADWGPSPGDPLAQHKTLNYWSRRLAYERGLSAGADEVLFATDDGRIWEGSRTNLFLVQGRTLITPGLNGPVLPGIMRGLVLELAAGVGLEVRERGVFPQDLAVAGEVFLTNSVRGIVPVEQLPARTLPAPGAWTERLRDRVERRLLQERGQS